MTMGQALIVFSFQHTAARRRLEEVSRAFEEKIVSTHSRPKAAAVCWQAAARTKSFNTQPPEGGWS